MNKKYQETKNVRGEKKMTLFLELIKYKTAWRKKRLMILIHDVHVEEIQSTP